MSARSKVRILIGLASSFLGCVLVLSSSLDLTGFVISESVGKTQSSIFGIILLTCGLALLFIERKERESDLVKIVRTKRFQKAIKKHDPNEIARALGKIGTGLGKEKILTGRYKGYHSIKTTKGGRIIYRVSGDENILEDYLPQHQY